MNRNARVKFSLAWLLAYVTALGLVLGSMTYFRAQTLAVYGDTAAQGEWDKWREDAKKRSTGDGPVKQRVPKSVEPPALVLMRDYFLVCLALAVLLSSVLFATFMFFLRGVLNSSSEFIDRSPPETS